MRKKDLKPPVPKAIRIIQIIMVLTALAIPIAIVAWLMWHGSPKEILAVADKFKPQEGWVLVHEEVRPPANFCGDQACPEVVREWKVPKFYEEEELTAIIIKAYGNDVSLRPDIFCNNISDGVGRDIRSCGGSIFIDMEKNSISIYQKDQYQSDIKKHDYTLTMYVQNIRKFD